VWALNAYRPGVLLLVLSACSASKLADGLDAALVELAVAVWSGGHLLEMEEAGAEEGVELDLVVTYGERRDIHDSASPSIARRRDERSVPMCTGRISGIGA
jgi:hypothetical protein